MNRRERNKLLLQEKEIHHIADGFDLTEDGISIFADASIKLKSNAKPAKNFKWQQSLDGIAAAMSRPVAQLMPALAEIKLYPII
ncbi:hypothetical protein SynBIOSE41_00721 [Synechococcus sp. BIOS-E4-1]|uniref:hypothetical protein n=1 Tax=Synechococcus sp. BIOS-E4-1 TaxID=1400864 RepID=UPI0016465D1C|nr:hypothetical protein [Synechococcus sp. BIOS-E4-1]QNI53258.1 hypothetical protein SynBIOSE41_00721 [Synechococcus sp. BIOS-E4-1]